MRARSEMHSYQVFSHDKIVENNDFALFLDMGMGKTVSTLTAINTLMFEELEIRKVLVIAPKNVAFKTWAKESQQWAHLAHLKISVVTGNPKQREKALREPADIYTLGVDNTVWICGLYGGSMLPFDMVVIDELSCFKSHDSKRFKALRKAVAGVRRVVGLTGTPAPNGLIDLWSQMFLLDRGERLGKTVTYYRNRFFTYNEYKRKYTPVKGAEEEIYGLIGDICVSMKACDYLDMPERVDNYVRIDMPADVETAYKKFERDRILELLETEQVITPANAAGLSSKLLQYASGAIYDADRNIHKVHSLKIEALEELVQQANGRPMLVAYNYQHERDRILEAFPQAELFDGRTSEDRWNRGEIPIMLMHPKSGGHGLNLQDGGNTIVWFGNTWSSELYQQLNARALRQGQKSSFVAFYYLVVNGTMDEDVIASLEGKIDTQDALLEAVKARVKKLRDKYC